MTGSVRIEVDVAVTAEQLATAFCDMDSEEQAEFLAAVSRRSRSEAWPHTHWEMVGHSVPLKDQGEVRSVLLNINEGLL